MADDTEQLAILVTAKLAQFEKDMAKMTRVAGDNFSAVEKRSELMTARVKEHLTDFGKDAFGELAKGALPAIATFASASAAIDGIKSALESFRKISDESKASGLDAEFFQGIAHQADLGGVGIDEISKALEILNVNSGKAELATGRMSATLKLLDPQLLKQLQLTTSQEERVKLVADALNKQTDASKKAAIATAAFGDAGAKLVDVFSGGRDTIREVADEAQRMGLIVSDNLISQADELGIKFSTASKILDVQFKEILVQLAPVLVAAAQGVDDLIISIKRLADPAVSDAWKQLFIAQAAGPLGSQFTDVLFAAKGGVNALTDAIAASQPTVQSADQALADYVDNLQKKAAAGIVLASPEDLAQLNSLIAALKDGTTSASDAQAALQAFGATRPDLGGVINDISNLAAQLRDVTQQSYALSPAQVTFRNADEASMHTIKPVAAPGVVPPARTSGGHSAADQEKKRLDDITASLQRQLDALHQTDREQQIATQLASAHVTATSKEGEKIAALTGKLYDQKSALQASNTAASALAETTASAFQGILDGSTSVTDALANVAKSLAAMALQAALLGTGPLAGLFGTAPATSGAPAGMLGSLFSSLIGGMKLAGGGHVSGAGSATSDSVPALLSNGEFVVNAAATARHGALLQAINEGAIGRFATGGPVTSPPSFAPANGALGGANDNAPSISISAPITVNGSAGTHEQNADLAARMGRELENTVRGIVGQELARSLRPGNIGNQRSR